MTSYRDQQYNQRGYNNRSNNQRYSGGSNNRNAELPDGYLAKGYYKDSDKKILYPEYIITYPKEIVRELKDNNRNKSSQLRRYYEYTVRIKDRLRQTNTTFQELESEIGRLIPFAEYALNRNKVTVYFKKFIEKNVNNIHDEKDFMAFAKHFEAIIANLPKEK